MAEAFGTIAAVAGMLEQAIELFSRIRDAAERQKELPELIKNYSEEVSEAKTIIVLIKNEDALKTESVDKSIAKLGAVGEILRNYLAEIAVSKGRIRDFFHQFLSGQKGEDKLQGIMRDLGNSKSNLSLHMQLSIVGLVRGVGDTVRVNTTTVEEINTLLREKLGSGHVLKISELLQRKTPNSDGTVTLTKDDIAVLSEQGAAIVLDRPAERKSQLTVNDNQVSLHSLQVNTPIGVDIWKDWDITVERNIATDNSIQWNGPASADVFLASLKAMNKQ